LRAIPDILFLGLPRFYSIFQNEAALAGSRKTTTQGLARFDHHKFPRRIGNLSASQMAAVKAALLDLLGL
jgi:hypothetical protein